MDLEPGRRIRSASPGSARPGGMTTWILPTCSPMSSTGNFNDAAAFEAGSGTDDEGNTVTATASATVTFTNAAPAIGVVKTASLTSVLLGLGASQAVTYTYAVTNTGAGASADPLSGVTLVDTDGTPILVSDGDGDALGEAGQRFRAGRIRQALGEFPHAASAS